MSEPDYLVCKRGYLFQHIVQAEVQQKSTTRSVV